MIRFILIFLSISLLLGCAASAPRYDNSRNKNLTINVNMDERGGLFSSVDIVAGINDFDRQCNTHYRGYVELAPGKNKIGLTPGVPTYLVVEVAFSSHSRNSNFSRGTILRPMKGKQYEVDVNYADNMYDFRLYEVYASKRKELNLLPETACKPM